VARRSVAGSPGTDELIGTALAYHYGTFTPKEYRFIFANPDKALLFKLTFG
jgi:hypothetical protein